MSVVSDREVQVVFVALGGEDSARNISEKINNFIMKEFQKKSKGRKRNLDQRVFKGTLLSKM